MITNYEVYQEIYININLLESDSVPRKDKGISSLKQLTNSTSYNAISNEYG